MNPQFVIDCLTAIIGEDNDIRDAAVEALRQHRENLEMADALVQMAMNIEMTYTNRTLCVYVLLNLDIPITDEMYCRLIPGLGEPEEPFVNALIKFMGRTMNLSTMSRMEMILSIPDELVKVKVEILNTFIEGSAVKTPDGDAPVILPVLEYLTAVLQGCTDIEIRHNASLGVNGMLRGLGPDEREPFVPFFHVVYSMPITDENLPVLINMYESAMLFLDPPTLYDMSFVYFQQIAAMAPLDHSDRSNLLLKFAYVLTDGINFVLCESCDGNLEGWCCDKAALVEALVLSCMASDYDIERWSSSIEDFIIDNIANDTDTAYFTMDGDDDEDDYDDENYNLRQNCRSILQYDTEMTYMAVDACREMMRTSPRHQDAAYYIMHQLLSSNTAEDIDLAVPDENPFCIGRYIKCVCKYGCEIDPGMLEEALNSDSFVLVLLTAHGLTYTDRFPELRVLAASKLFSMVPLFESSVLADHLEIIQMLIENDASVFIPILGDLIEQLAALFVNFVSVPQIAAVVTSIISIMTRYSDCVDPCLSVFIPMVIEALGSGETREMGLTLLLGLVNWIETIEVPPILVEAFGYALENLSPTREILKTVFELLPFFVRNGCGSVFLPWYEIVLNSDIDNDYFIYMSSIMIAFFVHCSNEEVARLLTALMNRANATECHRLDVSLVVSLCTMILIDKERAVGILEGTPMPFEALLSEAFIEKFMYVVDVSCHSYIDCKFIIAAMFALKEVPITYEQVVPMGEVAMRSVVVLICKIEEDLIKSFGIDEAEKAAINRDLDSSFYKDDPFILNNPVTHMPFRQFLMTVADGMTIPDYIAQYF